MVQPDPNLGDAKAGGRAAAPEPSPFLPLRGAFPPGPAPRGPVAAVPTYPPSYPEGPPRPPFPDSATASFAGPPSSAGSPIDSIVANLRNPDGTIDPATVSDVAAVLATLAGVNVTDADFDNAVAIAVAAGLAGMREGSDETGSNDDDHHHHAHREGHFNTTGDVQRYRDMFGTALRAAGDFIEESFASANSGADADGSVGGKDSAEVESLVAAAIEVAEENAAHFIDLGVGDGGAEGAEGADSGEAVDVDTAIELLDRVQGVLAAARGDFHDALNQSQQGAGVKAPGAPDGYLTAAQLLTLMGGMGAGGGGLSGLPVDENVGDPTVPGTKFPFNATDNTDDLGNIADKVAEDPLGYFNGLIDDLIGPNRDGGDAMVGAQSGPDDVVRTDPPTVDVAAVEPAADDGSPAAQFFEKTETQVAIPVAAVVLAGGIFAAYTSGLSGRLFGRVRRRGLRKRRKQRADVRRRRGGWSVWRVHRGQRRRRSHRPSHVHVDQDRDVRVDGVVIKRRRRRRRFRFRAARVQGPDESRGEERRGGEADSRREGGGVSATLSTAAAARSVQMDSSHPTQMVASTFDFRACDVHRNVGARVRRSSRAGFIVEPRHGDYSCR